MTKPYHETEHGVLYCGDCLEVMKQIADESVDLTVTSPPYDNLRDYKGYSFDFEGIAKELLRVTKDGGVVVWVVGDATINGSETGTSFKQALYFKEIGFNLHDTMIYEKNGFSNPSDTRYHQVFEYMFILHKKGTLTFNPIMDRKNLWESWGKNTRRQKDGSLYEAKERQSYKGKLGMRYNIWRYNVGGSGMSTTDKIAHLHPATFPEQLASDHIYSWSNAGDIVLDCFMGSGTTAIEAISQGKRYIGIDLNPQYLDIASRRIESELDQTTINLEVSE